MYSQSKRAFYHCIEFANIVTIDQKKVQRLKDVPLHLGRQARHHCTKLERCQLMQKDSNDMIIGISLISLYCNYTVTTLNSMYSMYVRVRRRAISCFSQLSLCMFLGHSLKEIYVYISLQLLPRGVTDCKVCTG